MREVDPRWLSSQIMIIDFGIAFLQEASSPYIGTPRSYCAPEFLFKIPRSVSSDIWALGCTIFEIRTGSRLFSYAGKPTRSQILMAMVEVIGTLPAKWWEDWPEGRHWYSMQTEIGGEIADIKKGTLFTQILDVGIHDGESPPIESSRKDSIIGTEAGDDPGMGTTNRLVALVGELTTSEAEEVIARMDKTDPAQIDVGKTDSGSGNSGSGNSGTKNDSGSSNAKSGGKSISSEGISVVPIGEKVIEITQGVENLNVIGDQSMARAPLESVREVPEIGEAVEFLEPAGTRVTVAEAEGLENLLRRALMFLPEQRLGPSELAKHHWFADDYND
jgi:serine/threonine protein kinase